MLPQAHLCCRNSFPVLAKEPVKKEVVSVSSGFAQVSSFLLPFRSDSEPSLKAADESLVNFREWRFYEGG